MIIIISVSNFHNLFKNDPNDSYKQTLLGGRSNEKKYRIQILESNIIVKLRLGSGTQAQSGSITQAQLTQSLG